MMKKIYWCYDLTGAMGLVLMTGGIYDEFGRSIAAIIAGALLLLLSLRLAKLTRETDQRP